MGVKFFRNKLLRSKSVFYLEFKSVFKKAFFTKIKNGSLKLGFKSQIKVKIQSFKSMI